MNGSSEETLQFHSNFLRRRKRLMALKTRKKNLPLYVSLICLHMKKKRIKMSS